MDKDLNTGFFLISKPQGISSFKVLYPIKRLFRNHRVGHAGTLDVEASGLLVVAVGKATRLVDLIHTKFKTYEFKIILGITSDSYDLFGTVKNTNKEYGGTFEDIQNEINQSLIGEIQQTPPIFSSVKYQGTKSYKLARRGVIPILKSRPVFVQSFEVLEYCYPKIQCKVVCSKGTYVRSLANCLGEQLGCGAVASDIHRTKIGEFSLKNALTTDEIVHQEQLESIENYFNEMSSLFLEDEKIQKLICGQTLNYSSELKNGSLIRLFNSQKKWIALVQYKDFFIQLKTMLSISPY